jgi:hypothetical protein
MAAHGVTTQAANLLLFMTLCQIVLNDHEPAILGHFEPEGFAGLQARVSPTPMLVPASRLAEPMPPALHLESLPAVFALGCVSDHTPKTSIRSVARFLLAIFAPP